MIDRVNYQVGTDLTFVPLPLAQGDSTEGVTVVTGEWIPLPGNFQQLDGVKAATPVGDYPMSVSLMNSGNVHGRFMAIDRLTFPNVAWFRKDFAKDSLGGLMNLLASSPNAVLMSQDLFDKNDLFIGDQVNISIGVNYEFHISDTFTVVGTFDYFPTVYEDQQVSIIGNLDYLDFYVGIPVPHGEWLSVDKGVNPESIIKQIPAALNISARESRRMPSL